MGSGEMAQQVKVLLQRHEDLSLAQPPYKSEMCCAHLRLQHWGSKGSWLQRLCWPSSLAEMANSRFTEGWLSQKEKVERFQVESGRHPKSTCATPHR